MWPLLIQLSALFFDFDECAGSLDLQRFGGIIARLHFDGDVLTFLRSSSRKKKRAKTSACLLLHTLDLSLLLVLSFAHFFKFLLQSFQFLLMNSLLLCKGSSDSLCLIIVSSACVLFHSSLLSPNILHDLVSLSAQEG